MLWEACDRGFRGGFVESGNELSGVLVSRIVPWINRATHDFSVRMVKHKEDAYMVNATFLFAVGMPLIFAACAYDSVVNRNGGVSLSICFLYHVLRLGPYFMNFAFVYTLCHKEGHASVARTGLWAAPYDKKGIFRYVYNWWIGLFYGVMPASFAVGHSVNHHKYNNAEEDVVSTSDKPRDNFVNFIAYLPRWASYALNISTTLQFIREGKYKTAFDCVLGSAYYAAWVWLMLRCFGTPFTVCFVVYPFCENIVLLACINWSWHAFVDPSDPSNEFVQSITILHGPINVLNEDAHVVHHQYPGAHWTQHPDLMRKHTPSYTSGQGSIFVGTHAFEIFALVVSGQYAKLAERYLGVMPPDASRAVLGSDKASERIPREKVFADLAAQGYSCKLSQPEVEQLLKQRLRACWWGPRVKEGKKA